MNKAANKSPYIWYQVLVGAIGLILSVVLHELFHIVMHIGEQPHVGLFPSHGAAIVEILVSVPAGYDLSGEEAIAYTITILTILLTLAIIFRIRDSADHRSVAQKLFPNDKHMHTLNPHEMIELADRANAHRIIHANMRKRKPKK